MSKWKFESIFRQSGGRGEGGYKRNTRESSFYARNSGLIALTDNWKTSQGTITGKHEFGIELQLNHRKYIVKVKIHK